MMSSLQPSLSSRFVRGVSTFLLLAGTLLIALGSPFNLHSPAVAEGTFPTATVTPVVNDTPDSTASGPTSDDAQARSGSLFTEVEGDPPPSDDVETISSRLVGIDFGQLDQVTNPQIEPKDPATGNPLTPKKLVLNLFDDVVLTGIVEHVEPTASGHAFWGSLDGVELGTMTLVVNGKIVVGTVRTPEAVYTIRTAGDGKYVIRQIDESSLPLPAEPLKAPSSPRDTPLQANNVLPDDGSEIDVMVVYTPLAKHREGGRAAIEALIDLFLVETNQAFVNSGVNHQIRLVYRDEVEYSEEGDSGIDLGRLINDSDGYMDHVHELRDLYAADIVHIVVGLIDVCGLVVQHPSIEGWRGYELVGAGLKPALSLYNPIPTPTATRHSCEGRNPKNLIRRMHSHIAPISPTRHFKDFGPLGWISEDESYGFGLTVSLCGGLTFAHEVGHNMGLNHDRYEAGVPASGSNYGYVNQRMFEPDAPLSARWRTIMAYGSQCAEVGDFYCSRVAYFSNPDKTYKGDPMGVPADHPSTGVDGPADAVGTLNGRREITANYRQSSTSPTPRVALSLSQYWLSEDGASSTVTATLHRPSSADTIVTVSASPSGAVTLSGSRTLTIPDGRRATTA